MTTKTRVAYSGVGVVALLFVIGIGYTNIFSTEYRSVGAGIEAKIIPLPVLNKEDYNARMLALAHYVAPVVASTTATSTLSASSTPPVLPLSTASTSVSIAGHPWPVASAYPNVGALLPFNRIVAYYGNFYSKGMGVLGEYPTDQLLAMLASTTAAWAAADPTTPVIPAIQYIAVVAQASAGKEGKYILRMPDDQIDHAIELANQIHGVVFLDVQVGKSTVQHEIPLLEKYLQMPNVHLAVDPEFSMKFGDAPGEVIGTLDATDINFTMQYLASLVNQYHLPPKVLVIHRFTYPMVTNYKKISPLPEVQVVLDMDGWGSQAKKKNTYNRTIASEPIQFTGVKLFYKNDIKSPSTGLLTTDEVLNLTPAPIYIQYQ